MNDRFTNHGFEVGALVTLFKAHDPYVHLPHLAPDDFSNERYRAGFERIRSLVDAGADLKSDSEVVAMMRDFVKNDEVATGKHVVSSLKKLTARRMAYDKLEAALDALHDFTNDADEICAGVATGIEDIRSRTLTDRGLITIADAVRGVVSKYEEDFTQATSGKQIGWTTGFPWLDKIQRLMPGNLKILGGRTGTGKTAYALSMVAGQLAENVRAAYFCREMNDRDLALRLLAHKSGEDSRDIQFGRPVKDMSAFSYGVDLLRGYEDKLVLSMPKTIDECIMLARKAREQHCTQVFYFDYLQQFRTSRPNASKREQMMEVVDKVKGFALDHDVACVGLAQLNRGAEEGGKPIRPQLKHLKECGDFEEYADSVWLLWNLLNQDKSLEKDEGEEADYLINCDISKQRIALDKRTAEGDTRCAMYCDKFRNGERYRLVHGFDAKSSRFYKETTR